MMRGILSVRHVEWFLKKKNGMKTIAAHVAQLKRCQSYKEHPMQFVLCQVIFLFCCVKFLLDHLNSKLF